MAMNHRLLMPRASGGGFDPRTIIGLAAWYDPSDSSTVTLDTGVSVLLDKSGNGRTMAQAVGNAQPTTTTLNGRAAMSFDGSNDQLVSAYSVPIGAKTMFVVSQPTSDHVGGVFGMVGTDRAYIAYGTSRIMLIGASGIFNTSVPYIEGTTYIHTGLWGETTRGLRVNGTSELADTYSGNSGGSALVIGGAGGFASSFMHGLVGEAFLYDRTLTDSECLSIERYLGAKWGVTI